MLKPGSGLLATGGEQQAGARPSPARGGSSDQLPPEEDTSQLGRLGWRHPEPASQIHVEDPVPRELSQSHRLFKGDVEGRVRSLSAAAEDGGADRGWRRRPVRASGMDSHGCYNGERPSHQNGTKSRGSHYPTRCLGNR